MKSTNRFMRTAQFLNRQAGMTLMEIIAALAIIAAVVVGALALFNSAQSSNTSVTIMRDIVAIRSAIQQLYLGQGTYKPEGAGDNDMNAQLQSSRKMPTDLPFISNNEGFRTPWGGTLTVKPFSVSGVHPYFSITMTDVPPDICTQITTNLSTGWSSTYANNQLIGSIKPEDNHLYPVKPQDANNNCNPTSSGSGVKVEFRTIN